MPYSVVTKMLSRLDAVLERVQYAIVRDSGVHVPRPFIPILLNMTEILVRYTVLIKQDGKSVPVLFKADPYQYLLAKDVILQQATANLEHLADELISWLPEHGECNAMISDRGSALYDYILIHLL